MSDGQQYRHPDALPRRQAVGPVPVLCRCGGIQIVAHRRGVDGCRYSPAAVELLRSIEDGYGQAPSATAMLSPVARRWQPAGRGLPDALLEPLGRFMEAGAASG